jgi:hypothetical protein
MQVREGEGGRGGGQQCKSGGERHGDRGEGHFPVACPLPMQVEEGRGERKNNGHYGCAIVCLSAGI